MYCTSDHEDKQDEWEKHDNTKDSVLTRCFSSLWCMWIPFAKQDIDIWPMYVAYVHVHVHVCLALAAAGLY